MNKYTRLDSKYWRYVIKVKGRSYASAKLQNEIANSSNPMRRDELVNIYLEVFRAAASR